MSQGLVRHIVAMSQEFLSYQSIYDIHNIIPRTFLLKLKFDSEILLTPIDVYSPVYATLLQFMFYEAIVFELCKMHMK